MGDIDNLVMQAMEQWDEETNCGENDPDFQGEVGEEISSLVDGLSQEEVGKLLEDENPLVFVEEKPANGFILTCTKCGRRVNITEESERYHISEFGWGVKLDVLREFTRSTLGIYDIEDDCGQIITCPCGNSTIYPMPNTPVKAIPVGDYDPADDDDPEIPD